MLGWFGNVFIVIGAWKIGDKWRPAFLFSVVGEAAWIVNALVRRDWALAFICVVFLVLALRNYVQWGRA